MQLPLVEDIPVDVRLTREAFREADDSVQLHVASAWTQDTKYKGAIEP